VITTLDVTSWSKELVSGNAEFVEVGSTIYVVSQVRATNPQTFVVLKSNPTPPDPGQGNSFSVVATYSFPSTNSSFDPAIAYDALTGFLHIIGMQDNGKGVDLLKFTFNTNNNTLSAPVVLVNASYIRDAYDICILNSGRVFIAVAVTNPQSVRRSSGLVNTTVAVTNVSVNANIATLTANSGIVSTDAILLSGFNKAAFLNNSSSIVSTANPTTLTVPFVTPNYPSTADNGLATWLPGHSLLGFELDNSGNPVTGSPIVIATSPTRTGDTFGSVSLISPDGLAIEVYYESHPKYVTFTDQQFKIMGFNRNSSLVWQNSPTQIYSFVGRYSDNRLTVVAQGTKRYLSQVYFYQLNQPFGLVGNTLIGYQATSGGVWQFNTIVGSPTASLTQANITASATQGVHLTYLLQNLSDRVTQTWPLHVASIDLNTLATTDVPGFYNNLRFTWLRGTKSIVDDNSLWAVVGEKASGATNSPVYLSNFNVPPVAVLQPSTATVHRGQPFSLSAAQTSDGDVDSLTFTWTKNDPDVVNVVLTPTASTASLLVGRGVGGGARSFVVAVVAVDSQNSVELHPALVITNVSLTSNVVTFSTVNTLVAGQQVLVYNLTTATFLNDNIFTVLTASGSQFTANFTHANYVSAADTGKAIASPQFATCAITVPFNAAPTIDFTHDAISHQVVTLPIAAARNATVAINPTLTGVTDIDDVPVYTWVQTTGTPVTILNGTAAPSIQFLTNGVSVNGEALVFELTVDDGVNAPVVSTVTVNVAAYNFAGLDTHKIARSIFTNTVNITNVAITSNVLTVLAANSFLPGQDVFLTGLTSPASLFLNNKTIRVTTASASQFTGAFVHANYSSAPETGTASASVSISQRNSTYVWAPLAPSTLYTDLVDAKRTSVLDGTDRYICISPGSVQVLGGINPQLVLLRKLLTPGTIHIVDAVHTEDDWTLVLDANGNLYRYTTAPLINTDNPDTLIRLSDYTGLTFNKIYVTTSHSNARVIVLTGVSGGLLLQVRNSDLQVQGTIELTSSSGFVYGSNNIQWIRASNVENLRTGKLLLGSVTSVSANITNVSIVANALTVVTANKFTAGQIVTLSGLTTATFLNNVVVTVVSAFANKFIASFVHADYASTPDTGTATTPGKTYETLIDLSHGQIIGTWDASNLKNSFVYTGEFLFEPNSGYSGRTQFPTQNGITLSGNNATLSWSQPRADLVTSYNIQYSTDGGVNWFLYSIVNSGAVQSIQAVLQPGTTYAFRVQAVSPDGPSIFSNIQYVYAGLLNPPQITPITEVTASGFNYIFTIRWTPHNPDAGAVVSYSLEKQVGGGGYSVIYTGTTPSFITAPLPAGNYDFRVRALVGAQNTFTPYFTYPISEPLIITTLTPPAAPVNQPYTYTLAASGGVAPYTWSLASGTLPHGVTLNSTSGVISGTPDTPGTSTPTIRVTDSASPTPFTHNNGISITVS
jgi:hypothetical protein